MFKLVFVAIVSGFVSMVQCGPMPEQRIDGGQNRRQEQQKYAVDHFTTGLVGNPKIRENYLNCFLDKGPCSPEAKNIKPGMVPEAIQNECEHCTELQRKVIEKMMCYLNNHQPDILKEVAAKFDPNGEYMKQYINTIERNGNKQFLNPNLFQYQPQQNSNQPQHNPNQPQHNPNQPQQNPNQPQQNPNQPQQHQHQNQYHPQQNLHQPQQNQHQPQPNSNQPQQHPNQPQQHPNQPQQHPNQPQQHPNQSQQNPNPPQQHQHQYQPQQNPSHPQQHQHQHQHQLQQYQNQPQQHQHEQQLKGTVITTAPISTVDRKP